MRSILIAKVSIKIAPNFSMLAKVFVKFVFGTFRHFSVYFEAKSDFDREFEKETPHRPITYQSNN